MSHPPAFPPVSISTGQRSIVQQPALHPIAGPPILNPASGAMGARVVTQVTGAHNTARTSAPLSTVPVTVPHQSFSRPLPPASGVGVPQGFATPPRLVTGPVSGAHNTARDDSTLPIPGSSFPASMKARSYHSASPTHRTFPATTSAQVPPPPTVPGHIPSVHTERRDISGAHPHHPIFRPAPHHPTGYATPTTRPTRHVSVVRHTPPAHSPASTTTNRGNRYWSVTAWAICIVALAVFSIFFLI